MTLAAFVSSVLALLLAPGPTNTLIGLAGAQRGLRGVVRLLPWELAGYLTTVLPLTWLGAQVLAAWPDAALALKLAAAGWILVVAVRLWSAGTQAADAPAVTPRQVYVTTMLNPKALVFGLVLLPPAGTEAFPLRLGIFCLLVAGVALLWGGSGALTRMIGATAGGRLLILQRCAASWLAIVAFTLLGGVIAA